MRYQHPSSGEHIEISFLSKFPFFLKHFLILLEAACSSTGGGMLDKGVIGRCLDLGKVIIRLCLHECILVLAPCEPEGVPVEGMGRQ